MSDSERKDRRYAANPSLLVRCDTWGDFVQLYAQDVSQGGMFILTDDPPPLLSSVEVKMGLPEGHEVMLQARVVHVISPEQARIEGRQPGVGVEFQETEAEFKYQIHHLIEFARWEGSNPNASFSQHLSEVSLSQPPAKLMESLPPGPMRPSRAPSAPAAGAEGESPADTLTRRRTSDTSRSQPGISSSPSPRTSLPPEPTGGAGRTRSISQPGDGGGGRTRSISQPGDSGVPSAGESTAAQTSSAPKPADTAALRLGMTHVTHKRYAQAVREFDVMLQKNPEDREAKKWLHLAQARLCISKKNDEGAAKAYQQMLEIDESNREARQFVRDYHKQQRLSALPFGRLFAKKKP